MNPLLHTISLVSATTSGALFSAIWEGAVLAACVALWLRLTPGLSAAARSVVWTTVFLLLTLLHVLPSLEEHLAPDNGINHSPFHLQPAWSVVIAGVWAKRLLAGSGRSHRPASARLSITPSAVPSSRSQAARSALVNSVWSAGGNAADRFGLPLGDFGTGGGVIAATAWTPQSSDSAIDSRS